MNSALDQFADNPIIDELVFWPPRSRKILSVRACCVMFRKPFIEVQLEGGDVFQRHFDRDSFAEYWAEASVILETITSIELISEFDFEPVADGQELVQRVLATRAECIEDSEPMYAEGMYEQFLMQYGEDCKNLPSDTAQKIAHARKVLGSGD